MPTHITQYFTADNDRLDIFYAAFKKAYIHANYNEAGKYFALFSSGLIKHISWEESLLFPMINKEIEAEITLKIQTLIEQHITLTNLLNEVKNNLANREYCLSLCNTFEETIENHNQIEESIIYPECDNTSDLEALAETFAKINQIPTLSSSDT